MRVRRHCCACTTRAPSDTALAAHRYRRDNISLEIRGKSGTMVFGRGQNPNSDKNRLSVRWSAIREVASDGTVVGRTGRRKHSFSNFAGNKFNLTAPRRVRLQNVSCDEIGFKGHLNQGSIVDVRAYMVREFGNITSELQLGLSVLLEEFAMLTMYGSLILRSWQMLTRTLR